MNMYISRVEHTSVASAEQLSILKKVSNTMTYRCVTNTALFMTNWRHLKAQHWVGSKLLMQAIMSCLLCVPAS